MYLMAQSCLHVVINFPRPPKPDQNMLYLSLFHRPLQNSAETGKFCRSAQNTVYCGKLWSLGICIVTIDLVFLNYSVCQ